MFYFNQAGQLCSWYVWPYVHSASRHRSSCFASLPKEIVSQRSFLYFGKNFTDLIHGQALCCLQKLKEVLLFPCIFQMFMYFRPTWNKSKASSGDELQFMAQGYKDISQAGPIHPYYKYVKQQLLLAIIYQGSLQRACLICFPLFDLVH